MRELLPIAVIITTFNSEKFIDEAIESIKSQCAQPTELIVVDNGSSDRTQQIVERFDIPFYIQTDGKVGTSRNLGLAKTTAPLIKYLDGDDWLESSALERLYAEQLKSGAPYIYGQSQNVIDPSYTRTATGSLAHLEVPVSTPITLTSLVTRDTFTTYGLPESDNHSWNRWFMSASQEGIATATVSEVVGFRRIHNENISHQEDAKSELFKLIALKLEKSKANNE